MTEEINATAVRVEWDAIRGISEDAFSYVVIYGPVTDRRRQSETTGNKTVPGDQTEADISGLDPDVTYHFEVVVSVEVDGEVFTGETSDVMMIVLAHQRNVVKVFKLKVLICMHVLFFIIR